MYDLILYTHDAEALAVAWDYCLENNIVMLSSVTLGSQSIRYGQFGIHSGSGTAGRPGFHDLNRSRTSGDPSIWSFSGLSMRSGFAELSELSGSPWSKLSHGHAPSKSGDSLAQ